MTNIVRAVIGIFYLAVGGSCLFFGNFDWMVAVGFKDWVLPVILMIIGLGFLVISAIKATQEKAPA